jgi:Xaa-Pro aminopeptidase
MPLMDSTAIRVIQGDLQQLGIDGWLFVNHHTMDPVAVGVLGLDPGWKATRRWWYYVPRTGEPVKIIHAVEPEALRGIPGEIRMYASHHALLEALARTLPSGRKVAMQYSPMARLPMVSLVDGGTIELIRSLGPEVVSSADLLQRRHAQLNDDQIDSHVRASSLVYEIKDEAFAWIRSRIKTGQPVTDCSVQGFVVSRFTAAGLTCDGHPPIVAINANAANPHFALDPDHPVRVRPGDRVLLDLWARLEQERSVYADICWCAFIGGNAPAEYAQLFAVVVEARDSAVDLVRDRFRERVTVTGAEVDRAARAVLERHGVAGFSVHRTGHSIDTDVHGRGANIDSYETDDTRQIIPRTCFSIEPALYKPPLGVRTEINVLVDAESVVKVHGSCQPAILCLD